MKRAIPFVIGLLGVVLIAASACGGDDDATPAERPRGTTAPVATSAPPTTAPATTAPTATTAPVATVAAPTQAPTPMAGGDAAAGKAFFAGASCVGCHTIQGVSTATIGPELTNVATNAGTRVAGMSAEAYIREAIEDPPAFVVEGYLPIMPATIRSTMSDTEFKDLVAYLLTLD